MRCLFVVLLALFLVPAQARADQAWLVVSDIHLDPYAGGSAPSAYGSDTNWALWRSALTAMQRADPDPEVVIVAGDLLAHHFSELARAHHASAGAAAEETMRRVAAGLAAAFPRAQFAIALGNNDDPCGDYRTAPNTPYLKALARIWAPLVDRNGAAPGFARAFAAGGRYTAQLPVRSLRAVVLDDVYWSVLYRACGGTAGDPGAAALAWLGRTLAEMPKGTHAVVIAHIPAGVDAASTLFTHRLLVVPFLQGTDERAYVRDLAYYGKRIAFGIAGHVHRSDFRTLGAPTVIAPSISPIYDNDPAFLRLRVALDGTLHDYTLYAYDPQRAAWGSEFDFDAAYGARSVDAAAMHAAHARIANDPIARARWSSALVAGSPHAEVTAATWRTPWCAQTHAGDAFVRCAGLRQRLFVLPIVAGLLGIVVAASLVLIIVRLGGRRRAR
ncbi:MAG: metallophosphoesterase [Candidatus Tyrphobacter sp.]